MEKNLPHIHDNKMSQLQMEEKILNRVEQYKVPFTTTKEEALAKLKARIDKGEKVVEMKVTSGKSNLTWMYSAAAVLLAFVLSWYIWLYKPLYNVVADKGHQTETNLPDGSKVSLNAESKISFDKNNFSKERKINLEGEAFFEVQKGETFSVNTHKGSVMVLGTSFNVYSRDNKFKTSCYTGKVLVSVGKESVTITPGESAELVDNKLTSYQESNIETVAKWRSGEFYYKNTPLLVIFNEIERQYNITFELPNVNNKFFTGGFNNKNLVETLDIICIPMGLTYEIGSNGKVSIHDKTQ